MAAQAVATQYYAQGRGPEYQAIITPAMRRRGIRMTPGSEELEHGPTPLSGSGERHVGPSHSPEFHEIPLEESEIERKHGESVRPPFVRPRGDIRSELEEAAAAPAPGIGRGSNVGQSMSDAIGERDPLPQARQFYTERQLEGMRRVAQHRGIPFEEHLRRNVAHRVEIQQRYEAHRAHHAQLFDQLGGLVRGVSQEALRAGARRLEHEPGARQGVFGLRNAANIAAMGVGAAGVAVGAYLQSGGRIHQIPVESEREPAPAPSGTPGVQAIQQTQIPHIPLVKHMEYPMENKYERRPQELPRGFHHYPDPFRHRPLVDPAHVGNYHLPTFGRHNFVRWTKFTENNAIATAY